MGEGPRESGKGKGRRQAEVTETGEPGNRL